MKRIILVGAGHAHIAALRIFRKTKPDTDIILINDGPHAWYTGALPALIRGDISEEQARLDLPKLAAKCGVRFIDALYNRHCEEPRDETIHLSFENHAPIQCGTLSLSIGGTKIPGGVKPISTFLSRIKNLETLAAPKIVIIGAGAAGIELALALRIRLGKNAKIYLQPSESGILHNAPPRVRRIAATALQAAQIIIDESPPETIDEIIRAYTPEPTLTIRPTLQLTTHDNIFATGDCAKFSQPLPRSGAIAVRQGRTLAHNLTNARLRHFNPPASTLAIMSLNATEALAWYGKYSYQGRTAMLVKMLLDKNWVS